VRSHGNGGSIEEEQIMASGPYGITGGWQELITQLNDQYANNLAQLSNKFKDKHGNNGNGDPALGKKQYKFGHFADKNEDITALDTPGKRGRFLIDAGEHRWDPDSLRLLEHAVKHSLTNTPPKKITFVAANATLPLASAEIKNQNAELLTTTQEIEAATSTSYTITIKCPPAIWP
jgi:hypothetical protein